MMEVLIKMNITEEQQSKFLYQETLIFKTKCHAALSIVLAFDNEWHKESQSCRRWTVSSQWSTSSS